MMKNIKNIRQLDNARVLVVSSDQSILDSLDDHFISEFKDFVFTSSLSEIITLSKSGNFDLVIIDTNIEGNFDSVSEEITINAPALPKIIISDDCVHQDIIAAINCSAYTFLSKPLRTNDIKLAIIMCLNRTKRGDKIEFQQGIYFDEYRDQFFRANGILLEFTKLEKGFLKLLIANKDRLTPYDEIEKVVWRGKKMSVFTMRNIVSKIRQKTYYEIIVNYSNKGYLIDNINKN